MKNIKTISLFVLLLGAIAFTSCKKEKENNLKQEIGSVEMTAKAITDSSIVVNTKADYQGIITMYLVDKTDETPNAGDLIEGNLDNVIDKKNVIVKSGDVVNVEFNSNIQEGLTYSVLSALSRYDGNMSNASQLDFKALDDNGPLLLVNESFPKNKTIIDPLPKMELVFNEEVILVDDIAQVDFFGIETGQQITVTSETFTVDGNIVKIDLSAEAFIFDEYVLVEIPEGSFTDINGNPSKAVVWEHDGTEFTRLDYYFEIRSENVGDMMPDFLGLNDAVNISPFTDTITGDFIKKEFQIDLELVEGTDNSVKMPDYIGFMDLEIKFDYNSNSILMERTETGFYFYLNLGDEDDEKNYNIYPGEPTESTDWKLVYMPNDPKSLITGTHNRSTGEFNLSYELLAVNLGSLGVFHTESTQVRDFNTIARKAFGKKPISNTTTTSVFPIKKLIKHIF